MPNKNSSKPAAKAAASKKSAAKAPAKAVAKAPVKKAAARPAAPVKAPAKTAKAPEPKTKKLEAKAPEAKAKVPASKPQPESVTEEMIEKSPADLGGAPVQLSMDPPPDEDVILTDAEGRRYCKVKDCDQYAVVEDHCRFHYLLLWKRIQVRRRILLDGKLERYVEELTARYPDKFLEMIRKDLRTEKDFLAAIAELEIDESAMENEFEDENSSFIDEVRGMSSEPTMSDEEEF